MFMEDSTINPSSIIDSFKHYDDSVRVLARLLTGDKVYYDPKKGDFSVSRAKEAINTFWGPGYLANAVQNVSRKIYRENADTTVNAFKDFSEKLNASSELINKAANEKVFKWEEWNELEFFISRINNSIVKLNINDHLDNLKNSYASSPGYPPSADYDKINQSVESFKHVLSDFKKTIDAIDEAYIRVAKSGLSPNNDELTALLQLAQDEKVENHGAQEKPEELFEPIEESNGDDPDNKPL